uniref:Translation initiation factor IF-1, chloroplastic n=1 Tax=Mesembryanthemum crystallinum TaxID=3544 RepID=IF1C_MESCR|nr:RecName: Full=Translation initiation factor IF-1, chloroplastic; Flags: Precursor [Mesembryanthemum crystallinum]AAK38869.1 translation initiation factor IF1 [Mesembryanthemum crystallinum]
MAASLTLMTSPPCSRSSKSPSPSPSPSLSCNQQQQYKPLLHHQWPPQISLKKEKSNESIVAKSPVIAAATKGGSPSVQEQKWIHEGVITESLPNGMFWVKLDNCEDLVLGYISGRIRRSFIRVLPGDRVKIEVSRYDSTRGRITYRLRNNKDATTT